MASTMDESTPEVQTPSNVTPLLMMSLIWLTAVAGSHLVTSLLGDRDVGILGEGLLEAGVAVGVGRVAGDAAHVDDGALLAHLLEQGLGAKVGVLDLVVGQVVGARGGDERVDRDDRDARPRWPRRSPG